jgi:hypothetical protein
MITSIIRNWRKATLLLAAAGAAATISACGGGGGSSAAVFCSQLQTMSVKFAGLQDNPTKSLISQAASAAQGLEGKAPSAISGGQDPGQRHRRVGEDRRSAERAGDRLLRRCQRPDQLLDQRQLQAVRVTNRLRTPPGERPGPSPRRAGAADPGGGRRRGRVLRCNRQRGGA